MLGLKIAIVGTHGSGKTTLLYDTASTLKKNGYSVSIAREVARFSSFLNAGEKNIHAQMDLFGLQITEEMSNARNHDILLCDRSILDILVYSKVLYPNLTKKESLLLSSMESTVPHYMQTYDIIFRTIKMYNPTMTRDNLRPKEQFLQEDVHHRIKQSLDELEIDYVDLPSNNEVDFMNSHIVELLSQIKS